MTSIILPDMDHGHKGFRPRREHPRFAAYGSVPGLKTLPDVMPTLIPRSEWSGRIKDIEARGERLSDMIDWACRDQQQSNFCFANAPCAAAEVARKTSNDPYVELSAAGEACLINGYVNQGGWGIDVVKHLSEVGACSVALWPNTAIDRQYDNAASEADRKNHMALEWIDVPANFDAMATCLLSGWPCCIGLNWWGHEIIALDVVETSPGVFGAMCRNSWGDDWGSKNVRGVGGFLILDEGKATPDDCQAIRAATASSV